MKIATNTFQPGQRIPAQYSKKGGNVSPALTFSDVPAGARSLVLIMDDPDAPSGLFTHWVVYDIDPRSSGCVENQPPGGGTVGMNSWGETAYGGPQPPDREHRYFFRLYALDALLNLSAGAERAQVDRAMDGHVIAEADYMGRYAPGTREVGRRPPESG